MNGIEVPERTGGGVWVSATCVAVGTANGGMRTPPVTAAPNARPRAPPVTGPLTLARFTRFEAEDAIENDYWQNIVWGTDYPHVVAVDE